MLKSSICLAKSGTFRTFAAENRQVMEEKAKEYVFWVEDHPAEGPYDTVEAAIDDAQWYYEQEDDSVLGETVDGEICSIINLGYIDEYDTRHVAEQVVNHIKREGYQL